MYHAHPQFRYGGGIWMVQRIRDATANTFSFRFIKVTRTKASDMDWVGSVYHGDMPPHCIIRLHRLTRRLERPSGSWVVKELHLILVILLDPSYSNYHILIADALINNHI